MSSDPFFAVKENVVAQHDRVKYNYSRIQRLIRACDTYTNEEFKDLLKGLRKDIRSCEKDLKGLRLAVEMIDKNRVKFGHIKDTELASRKQFVNDTQTALNGVKLGLDSSSFRRKLEDDELNYRRRGEGEDDEFAGIMTKNGSNNSTPFATSSNKSVSSSTSSTPFSGGKSASNTPLAPKSSTPFNKKIERENNDFIQNQKLDTSQKIAEQDENLMELGGAVDRLQDIATGVNEEVKLQSGLLDDLEKDLDGASSKMDYITHKLGKLLKTKDGCQIWTIVILFVILVVLGR